eukprot:superscaffoldBa00003480_g17025
MDRVLILLVAALMVYVAPEYKTSSATSTLMALTVNITRTGCGVTKLCLETPDNCDPAGNTSCLFGSVNTSNSVAPNGTELSIELRGDSSGYVALGLTGTTMLFICAKNSSNNGSFFFRTTQRNNSNTDAAPTSTERRVTEIRGSVHGNVIRCEFNVPNVNATNTRSSDTTFSVLLGVGSFDGSK